MGEKRKISLVVSDVDGTLLTQEKVLTPRACAAVQALYKAGIKFAVTSGRPPRGMAMLQDPLELVTPMAGFNGGQFVTHDFTILEQKTLSADISRQAIELIHRYDLDVWVFNGKDWLVSDMDGPHVRHEAWAVKFDPKVIADFDDHLDKVAKIVGVSDDFDRVRQCESEAQALFGAQVSATRSQSYYLDITNIAANKGAVVDYHVAHLGVPQEEVVTIGDGGNDILMFARSGYSIAMGNASDEVKAKACAVTESYNDEGFAKAMENIVLNLAT